MSKFVKGTSILGVLALGFGVWQITEVDQQENVNVQAIPSDDQSYETVIIDKADPEELDGVVEEKFVDNRTLQSIRESMDGNEDMKQLIDGLGRGVEADLGEHHVDTEEDWKELEQDTKEKQVMIKKLMDMTSHEDLKQMAAVALKKLEQTIQSRQFTYYKEAVESFKVLSDRL
ncbi:hypothetical protein GLW00_14920 [Halobacillus litoralis]|uniref:Uncharacterized protein n=1 Tax=Halobacillus litoralis TaxID=45668 RepID=A0A845FCG4_9BACI|nr:hypothetical protein [Halobacillus litoralis]MYL72152.1 hypothetical protein [Halobacillus litoralis]